jgi:hypothetical protein
MPPPIGRVIAAALFLVLAQAATDQGAATVVRDSKAQPANPAVEEGGYHLAPAPPPAIPYSLIGAIASRQSWFGRCIAWSLGWFDSFGRRHDGAPRRVNALPPGNRSLNGLRLR